MREFSRSHLSNEFYKNEKLISNTKFTSVSDEDIKEIRARYEARKKAGLDT